MMSPDGREILPAYFLHCQAMDTYKKNRMFSFEEKYQTTAKIGKSLKMTMKAAGIIALLRKKSCATRSIC
jgi:hypothetical protein